MSASYKFRAVRWRKWARLKRVVAMALVKTILFVNVFTFLLL